MDEEEVIRGPGSYERYDAIAISCQKKYFRLFRLQILVLSLIAFLSLLPPFSKTGTDTIKHSIELILMPNKKERLLALPLLRTVRETFASYRSSLP